MTPRRTVLRRLLLLPLFATLIACGVPAVPLAAPRATAVAGAREAPSPAVPSATPRAQPAPARTRRSIVSVPMPPEPTALPLTEPTALPLSEPAPAPPPEPTPEPNRSRVSGELTFARGSIARRPWLVMIDNHPDAYPQSGLDRAALVFEGLAEYGITRFIAVYADGITPDAGEIGPVRSTRLYFAQWAMGFNPVYAHAGGSPDGVALAETSDRLINFEALREHKYVWRDSRRVAPHNLYTSSELLRSFARDKAVETLADTESGFLFESATGPAAPEATAIDYYFLDRSSRAGFRYDAASNGYHRFMRDTPHRDRLTNQQLWTRNVVVMQVDEAPRLGDSSQRIDQQVVGSGEARVFMGGRAIAATWRKDAEAAPLRFYDAAGQELVFNAGPIWIAAIPSLERLTVK